MDGAKSDDDADVDNEDYFIEEDPDQSQEELEQDKTKLKIYFKCGYLVGLSLTCTAVEHATKIG